MNTPRTLSGISIALMVFMLAVWPLHFVLAADPDDYDYRIPVSVTNNSGADFSGNVCAEVNPAGLAAAGFLDSDALEAAAFDGAEAELGFIRTDPTSNQTCWFIEVPAIANGQQSTVYVYTGGTDNLQYLNLPPEATVSTPDHADIDPSPGQNAMTLWLDSITIDAYPATTLDLFSKASSYGLQIRSNGAFTAVQTLSAGTCGTYGSTYDFSAGLAIGVMYDVEVSIRGNSVTSCRYHLKITRVDNQNVTTENSGATICTSCAQNDSASPLILTAPAGVGMTLRNARVGQGDVDISVTERLDWSFAPDGLTVSQEGEAANSWTWKLAVEDQTDDDNTGTYSFISGLASVTVDARALQPIAIPPLVNPATSNPDVVGNLPDVNVTSASTTIDKEFTDLISFTGWPIAGMWLLFAAIVATAIGGGFAHVWEPLGVVLAPTLMGVGAFLGHYGWGYVIVAALMAFGISGALSVWRSK